MSKTVEIVVFELADGVSNEAFLDAVAEMQEDLNQMAGYLDRELSRDENGRWVDVLHWASKEEALAAAEAIMGIPSGQKFGSMINFETTEMLHSKPAYVHAR